MDEADFNAAERLADDIAQVCADPGFYRGLLLESGTVSLVDAVLDAAGSSDTREGRVEIEALRMALRKAGHPEELSAGRTAAPSAGIIRHRPSQRERLFLCPLRRCSRYWFPADHPGEQVPVCAAAGLPLRERIL